MSLDKAIEHGKEHRKNHYHFWCYSVPKWFRQEINRQRRHTANQLIKDGKEPPVEKRNAKWDWW